MSLSHRKLSAWYQQLGQQLEAGLRFADAVRVSQGTGPSARGLDAMARTVEAGGTISDALRGASPWLPFADILALSAAGEAGRMPRTLKNLSDRHAQIGAAKLRVILACAYPVGILHFALLLLPVVRMIDWEKGFEWSTTKYVAGVALTMLPLWGAAVAIWILVRRGSRFVTSIIGMVPAIGSYLRSQSLADFSFALGNFLEAGVPIGNAWATAGLITSSRELKAAATAIEATVARGEAPGKKLDTWRCFPADFVALYRTGEATGQLEINLLRLAAQNQEAANRALAAATVIYPFVIFVLVAGGIAYFVISIYGGYLKMLGKLAE